MNKQMIIATISVILAVIIVIVVLLSSNSTITNSEEIEQFVQDSNLDIIVNLGEATNSTYTDSNLLDVAMQLAEENDLYYEYDDENMYVQYATREDIHLIISDLTGNVVEAPIEISDFYYLYDSENDYYYFRPATPSYFKVTQINSLDKKGDNYTVNCLISKTVDTVEESHEAEISMTYKKDNSIVKYKINKIKYTK